MEKLNTLLYCEAGVSSGFLAQQMRGTAKKQGIMARVGAKSQNNIADDLPKTDILFIGPHLSYAFNGSKTICGLYVVPALMVPKGMYTGLDGKGLLALCMETLKEKGQGCEYIYQPAGLQPCIEGHKGHGQKNNTYTFRSIDDQCVDSAAEEYHLHI